MKRTRLLAVIGAIFIAAVVGAAALWGEPPGAPTVIGTAAIGEPAPDFTLTDFDGESFSLRDYEGRPVVMNFWASWCPFCVTEMPDFERVHRSLANKVVFLGVNQCESCQGGSRAAAEELARETGVTYRLAEDPNGSVFVAFGGVSMPTTIFVGTEGRVIQHVGGALSESQLRDYIARLFGVEKEAVAALSLDPDDIVEVIPMDGIPAIDKPVFKDVSAVDWLAPKEPLIAFELNGDARAYPLQIMTWHEIVNDEVGGRAVAVTFCPLCNTAIAFERPEVDGKLTTFGTSGKLIHSNLLMYDRATESLWPQVTGEALVGELKGTRLTRLPAQIVSWQEFKEAFPEGRVLSRDTGHDRPYGENPYPGYDDVDSSPFLFKGEVDGRLAAVERVLGLQSGAEVVAFPYFRLEQQSGAGLTAVNDRIGSAHVVVFWKAGTTSALDRTEIAASRDVGSAVAYSRRAGGLTLTFISEDGSIVDLQTRSTWNLLGQATSGRLAGRALEPLDAIDSFWFDWAAFHPDTKIWRTE